LGILRAEIEDNNGFNRGMFHGLISQNHPSTVKRKKKGAAGGASRGKKTPRPRLAPKCTARNLGHTAVMTNKSPTQASLEWGTRRAGILRFARNDITEAACMTSQKLVAAAGYGATPPE
jgi:hypothetical protein